MSLSTIDLAKARDSASAILEELKLDAYLYEVEPREETWEVKVECACEIDGGWRTVILKVPKAMLQASLYDNAVRQELSDFWRQKLSGCKIR